MSFSEWREVKLGDLVDVLGDGLHGTPKYDVNGDYYFINGNNLDGKIITDEKTKKVNYKEFLKYRKELNDRTILVSINGTLGNIAFYNGEKVILGKSACYFNVKKNCSKKFIKYIMHSHLFKHYINTYSAGTTIKNMGLKQMRAFRFNLPPLQEQKSIAHILSTLDDKIEVNNQINKTLEDMAQAIFKQWFMDFEFPNKDGQSYKSSGGEMVESELGMIPKGWDVGSFSEYISSMLGGDWGKDSPQGNYTQKVYCLRGADIEDIVVGNKGKMPERYIIEKNLIKKKLNSGNIVVEISGGSPTQSTGRITYVSNDLLKRYNSPLVATNFCRAIKLKKDEHMEFFYNYWKTLYQNNVLFHYENGTTGIKNLDISSFIERHRIIKPNENIVNMFTHQAKLFYKVHQNNGVENSQIEKLRDTLLPKLMSGEIRVPLDKEGDIS